MSCMSFGGILADDMGLGKTVQIIALLLANREKLREVPALIVAPASLVYNWEREIRMMILNILRFVNHKKRKASFTILLCIPFQQLIRNQKYVDILLPEQVETIVYSKMEPAQREIYIANLQNVLDNLKSKKNVGKQNERLEVLAELIRLRQLCCDPALLYEDYQGGSAKMETCLELIRNVIQGGSKVLVFSQCRRSMKGCTIFFNCSSATSSLFCTIGTS